MIDLKAIRDREQAICKNPCPCSCIKKWDNGGFYTECNCGNEGDLSKAEAWVTEQNDPARQDIAALIEAVEERDRRIVMLEKALRDILTGVSIHNDRLLPGQIALPIEGPIITAAREALSAKDKGEEK